MKSRKQPVTGSIACSLRILILLAACVVFLVHAVHAGESYNPVFRDWTWEQNGKNVLVPSPVPPLPPSEGFQIQERGPSCVRGTRPGPGPCPVGVQGAPDLRDQELTGKATCRGACGADCPVERCEKLPDKVIPFEKGTCTYTNVIRCPTAQSCKDHDACYDDCTENPANADENPENAGKTWRWCKNKCDITCFEDYNTKMCIKWAGLPGQAISSLGGFVDSLFQPDYDQIPLIFSDCPVYKEDVTPPTDTLLPAEWIQPDITAGPAPPPLTIQEGKWVGTWKFGGVSTGGCAYNHAGKLEWTISPGSGGTFSGTTSVGGIDLRWAESSDPQKKCSHYRFTTASGTVTGTVTGNTLKGTFSHTVPETGEIQRFTWTATLDGDKITGTIGSGGSFILVWA